MGTDCFHSSSERGTKPAALQRAAQEHSTPVCRDKANQPFGAIHAQTETAATLRTSMVWAFFGYPAGTTRIEFELQAAVSV